MLSEFALPVEIVGRFLNTAPVDLDGIAHELGIPVDIDIHLLEDVSGKIERAIGTPSGCRITINGRDHKNRQRFTLAHEIAHFVLHRDLIGDGVQDDAMYRSRLRSELETQANRYAADILMPAKLMREKWRQGMTSFAGMAAAFGVSMDAARIRMEARRLGG